MEKAIIRFLDPPKPYFVDYLTPITLYKVDPVETPLEVRVLKNRSDYCFICDHEAEWKYDAIRATLMKEAGTEL